MERRQVGLGKSLLWAERHLDPSDGEVGACMLLTRLIRGGLRMVEECEFECNSEKSGKRT